MADFSLPQPEWDDCSVIVGGVVLEGVKGFEYGVERSREPYYGRGSTPKGTTKGRKNFTCTLTLLQSTVRDLELLAGPGKDLTDLTFDIALVYEGIEPSVDTVVAFTPSGYSKSHASDADVMEIQVQGTARNIIFSS